MTSPDEQWRELLGRMRTLTPSDDGAAELHRGIDEGKYTRRRRRWGRIGGPAGLAFVGVALTGSAVAVAAVTGTLGFVGLAGTTAEDDDSAPALRGLVNQLEGRSRSRGRTRMRSGIVTRDGVDVQIILTDARVCISAPGQRSTGHIDATSDERPESERPMPRTLADVPSAEEGRKRFAISCAPIDNAPDQPLPVVTGTDARGSWLVAIAPDGVQDVQATTESGQTIPLSVSQNIAAGRNQSPFTSVSWTDPNRHLRHTSLDPP